MNTNIAKFPVSLVVLAALIVAVLGPPARGGLITLTVNFRDFGTETTTINDGDDGAVDCMIKLGAVNSSPHSQYGIEAIDPNKPIVVAKATLTSVRLTLTNIRLTAYDDFVSGTISLDGIWTHVAGDGTMNVAVGGTFGAGIDTSFVADAYSVTNVGEIGTNMLTVGPLTGPATPRTGEGFGDSRSKEISLAAGSDLVKETLTFSLDRVGSTLTFPNSADVLAAVPEPSTFVLVLLGLPCAALLRRQRCRAPAHNGPHD